MSVKLESWPSAEPSLHRLGALAELNREERTLLQSAVFSRRSTAAHRDILVRGKPIGGPKIVLSGWAAGVWALPDGRRQILSLAVPGDLIGMARQPDPLAACSIVAVTEVSVCPAPRPLPGRQGSGLAQAYAVSGALEQSYLYAQIARLGRFSAEERMIDFLIEMHDRLEVAGLVRDGKYPLPLTQEMMADMLGLTSVHVNRTIQSLRREGLLEIGRGEARLLQPERLRSLVSYQTPSVALASVREQAGSYR